MSSLRKLFAVGSTVAMLAAGLVMPGSALAAAHGAGSVVKSSDGTVWFIDNNGMRSAFTSAGAFQSYGFLSFSQVVDANSDDLALPTGPFIAPRDGSVFCATATKGSDVAGECSLITGGMKAAFTSASVFNGLGFSFSRAKYGDSSFLAKTTNIGNTTDAHRPGVLVNNHGTVQLVGTSSLLGIPSIDVFNSWGYSFSDVVPANGADQTISQAGVMTARTPGQLNPSFTSTPGNGAVTVGFGSGNPASSTLVAGQAQATLAQFSISGNTTINSITLKRPGVSADSTLSNVYLFEGSTRLTDSASVSGGNITFAGLNWSLNGSRTITVKSDIASGTSGQTVGVSLENVATTAGNATGTPLAGNIHTIATAPSLATVAISGASGTFTDPGTDINVWQGTLAVGTHSVTFDRLALRQIGSIQSADIKNFRLRVDGNVVSTASGLDANGYITFSPNSTLTSGSHTLSVLADVTGGSGRTVQMSLRGAYDISTTDTQYNVGILATGTFPFGPAASTVANGTVTVTKATDSPSANVVACASDVTLGKWTINAYGETTKVETLTVGVDSNDTDANLTLRNGRLLVDGQQVGSTTDVAAANGAATGQSFTTNFYVMPGTARTVEFRADMYDSEGTEEICGTNTFTSVQAALVAGSSNGIPQTSLTPINVPTANVNANAITIGTGSISLVANPTYPSQTFASPQSNMKLGSFILNGNPSEAVNLNTLTLDMKVGDNTDVPEATAADITNVYIKYNGNMMTAIKPTVSDDGNTYTINTQLPVNGTMTFDVYGDVGSDVQATDTVATKLKVSGVTASSNTSVNATLQGQTLTAAAGTITATLDASTPASSLVDDSGTVTTAAFKVAAVTDSYTVTDVTVQVATCTAVSMITIKDGSTVLGSKPCTAGASDITFSGLNVAVAANTNKVLTVELTMSTIGVGAGTTDSSLITTLTAFTARNSAGTSAAGTESNPVGNSFYAYKAVPTLTGLALPNSALAGGRMTIAKFTVSSGGTGTIAWKQAMFEISKPLAPTISNVGLYNADTGEQITAAVAFQSGTPGVASTCVADNTSCELLITRGTNADDDVVESINGAKNYEVRADIGGTLASGNFISVAYNTLQTNKNAGTNSTSFTWSDESASATGDTGVSTWQKDYLVKNLPLTWTLNRS